MLIRTVGSNGIVERQATPEEVAQRDADRSEALAQAKPEAIEQLNTLAEQERLKYVTPGSAKAMEYQRKEAEARIILSLTPYNADEIPFATRNAESTGRDLLTVATEWDTKAKAWARIGADIADKTEQGIKAIKALTNSPTYDSDAQAIIESIVW